ncbi:hypothetical protein MNBD_ALPHA09-905 [hydrothermal vent metagenome]|uniref:Murein endopeptidase K n=1 Tax=hydrothermal vent metagenome TaxID=652676 RepID=A0A3B0TVM5_9ZZZZ
MTKGLGTPALRISAWAGFSAWVAGILAWAGRGRRVIGPAALAVALSAGFANAQTRTLEIYNIHTKETNTVTFKRDGRYVTEGLRRLDRAMRDWRLDIVTKIDPELYDLLWELKTELGYTGPIHLISGHRSEKTNNLLRRTRGGQAKRSLHVRGSAADVFFPGVPLKRLRNAALVKQRGGVGYYPRSGQSFVHIDTGRVRHWPRIPSSQLAAILKRGTPAVPVRQVRETAVAVLNAPAPRQKPVDALTRQPAPFRLASATPVQYVRDQNIKHPAGTGLTAANSDEYRPGDWGESWLAPSRPKSVLVPQLKPTLVASSAPGTRLSTSLAPSTAVGYAAPPRNRNSASGRLLDGSSTTLAGMLANAERLSALASLGADAGDSGANTVSPPVAAKIRPTTVALAPAQVTPRNAGLGSQPARPIYTASLSPRGLLPSSSRNDGRFRAVLFAPAHALVFEPSPRIAATLNLGSEGRNALAFSGSLFAATEVGAFAPVRNEEGYRVSSLRVAEADRGRQGGFLALARRAYAWLTGS